MHPTSRSKDHVVLGISVPDRRDHRGHIRIRRHRRRGHDHRVSLVLRVPGGLSHLPVYRPERKAPTRLRTIGVPPSRADGLLQAVGKNDAGAAPPNWRLERPYYWGRRRR